MTNTAEDLMIPCIEGENLAAMLELALQKGWTQLHLIGSFFEDMTLLQRLSQIHGCPIDRSTVFRVREFPDLEVLTRASKLRTLTLMNRMAKSKSCRFLSNLTELSSLALIGIGRDIVPEAISHLRDLGQLTSLNLNSSYLNVVGAKGIADSLQHLTRLNSLDLSDNRLGTEGLRALVGPLQKLTQLTSLDLSGNHIAEAGASGLARTIQHLSLLRVLALASNSIGKKGIKSLVEPIQRLPSLRFLDLTMNSIGERGAPMLADILQEQTSLRFLGLSSNNLGASGARSISRPLEQFSELSVLMLRGNEIGDSGAKAIAGALGGVPRLTSLDLAENMIADIGAEAIAGAFRHISQLCSLTLSRNIIGHTGANAIAEQFCHMAELSSFDMSSNLIGDVGAKEIARRLHYLDRLSFLGLSDNRIGDRGIWSIAQRSSVNAMPSISILDLRGNQIRCIERSLLETRDARQILRSALESTLSNESQLTTANINKEDVVPVKDCQELNHVEPSDLSPSLLAESIRQRNHSGELENPIPAAEGLEDSIHKEVAQLIVKWGLSMSLISQPFEIVENHADHTRYLRLFNEIGKEYRTDDGSVVFKSMSEVITSLSKRSNNENGNWPKEESGKNLPMSRHRVYETEDQMIKFLKSHFWRPNKPPDVKFNLFYRKLEREYLGLTPLGWWAWRQTRQYLVSKRLLKETD